MNYVAITKDDMNNGEGLRVVLWVAGCNHNCKDCHNPSTHDVNAGFKFTKGTLEEIIEYLKQDYIQGLTLSGGDPLHPNNRNEVTRLCKIIKKELPKKDIWLYTGYKYEEIKQLEVMQYIDVLVDGRYVKELADINYPFAGSINQSLIDVQKSLKNGCKTLYKVVQ